MKRLSELGCTARFDTIDESCLIDETGNCTGYILAWSPAVPYLQSIDKKMTVEGMVEVSKMVRDIGHYLHQVP